MLFFIIATYSELLITIPRMLTTFSAILVATAGCVLYEKLRILSEKKSSQYEAEQFNVMCYLSVLVFGYVIFNLINNSTVIINGYRYNWELILFSLILSALAWTGFIFSFIRTPVSEKGSLVIAVWVIKWFCRLPAYFFLLCPLWVVIILDTLKNRATTPNLQ